MILLFFAAPATAQQASNAIEIYVAAGGNDNATGTQAAQLKTLTKEQAIIRDMQPVKALATVLVRGGTYYLTNPLTFTPCVQWFDKCTDYLSGVSERNSNP